MDEKLTESEFEEIATQQELSSALLDKLRRSPALLEQANQIADLAIVAWELGRESTPNEERSNQRIWSLVAPAYGQMLARLKAASGGSPNLKLTSTEGDDNSSTGADDSGSTNYLLHPGSGRMAASTQMAATTVVGGNHEARIHVAFIDLDSGKAVYRPVWVRAKSVEPAKAKIVTTARMDDVMRAAIQRAFDSAVSALVALHLLDQAATFRIDWGIDGRDASFEGASIALAFAVAAVAAIRGLNTDKHEGVVITGAVDNGKVLGVAQVATKWQSLVNKQFETLVLPPQSLNQLPPEAYASPWIRLIAPDTVEQAIRELFGEELGIAPQRLAAAGTITNVKDRIGLELWVTPPSISRSLIRYQERNEHNWFIGDRIEVCVRPDRNCYFGLINIGTSGEATLLAPDIKGHDAVLQAGQTTRFQLQLGGPPGVETLIAVAMDRPLDNADATAISKLRGREIETAISGLLKNILGDVRRQFSIHSTPAIIHSRGIATARGGTDSTPMPQKLGWRSGDLD